MEEAKKLIGKKGLFFDNNISDEILFELKLAILENTSRGNYPFTNHKHTGYQFFYCDPNLECKRGYYLENKKIQWRDEDEDEDWGWVDCIGEPLWTSNFEYRIKPEETHLTNRQVAEWLAKGNGEILNLNNMRSHVLIYSELAEKLLCESKIRKWSDTEWHLPTKEYIEGDNNEN